MMLLLNDDGVLNKVDEEKLIQVDEDELDELIRRHNELQDFKDKVFKCIDEKIKEADVRDCECCKNCVADQLLGELRKELEE